MSLTQKEQVGKALSERVLDGMTLGVGTGSTVEAALQQLAVRVNKEGLALQAVVTSYDSALACEAAGIRVLAPSYSGKIDLGFDGVDAIDTAVRAIKGKGAAMLLEKILAVRCEQYIFLADASKECADISSCPVPVEVIPEALAYVQSVLQSTFDVKSVQLRTAKAKHGAVITEKGNMVLDVLFAEISDQLENAIKQIVGVVESGIFVGYAQEALIARDSEIAVLKTRG